MAVFRGPVNTAVTCRGCSQDLKDPFPALLAHAHVTNTLTTHRALANAHCFRAHPQRRFCNFKPQDFDWKQTRGPDSQVALFLEVHPISEMARKNHQIVAFCDVL